MNKAYGFFCGDGNTTDPGEVPTTVVIRGWFRRNGILIIATLTCIAINSLTVIVDNELITQIASTTSAAYIIAVFTTWQNKRISDEVRLMPMATKEYEAAMSAADVISRELRLLRREISEGRVQTNECHLMGEKCTLLGTELVSQRCDDQQQQEGGE